ncbi:MAG TPA: hypothetical protein DCE41_19515, partial [Cytophagales bacterium]|nr:hypothetical protein [Cytophagales bacterium]
SAANNDGGASNSGHVRVFQESGGTWSQTGSDINGTASNNNLCPVALSSNGSIVAVGEPGFGANGRGAIFDLGLALPVALAHFGGTAQPGGIELAWQTASEQNNAGFEIQRSAEGAAWESIGWVHGQGTTNATHDYLFTDLSPHYGINYFRLKQVDFDGASEYSKVLSIPFQGQYLTLSVYPNPVRGHWQIRLTKPLETPGQIILSDLVGRTLHQASLEVGQERWEAPQMPPGSYVLSLKATGGFISKRVTVE